MRIAAVFQHVVNKALNSAILKLLAHNLLEQFLAQQLQQPAAPFGPPPVLVNCAL